MEYLQEAKIIGDEVLPLRLFKTIMNNCTGSHTEIYSGASNGIYAELLTEKCKNCIPHWHTYYEIIYFIEGDAQVQINNSHFKLSCGDIALMNSNDIHNIYGQAKYWVLLIDPFQIKQIKDIYLEVFPSVPLTKVITSDDNEKKDIRNKVINSINSIHSYYNRKTKSESLKIMGELFRLLESMHEYSTSYNIKEQSPPISVDALRNLNCVFDYINEKYTEHISLEVVASLISMSPNYFCRFFKKNIGKTFFEYLNFFRCSKAEVLINSTSMTLTEIALNVGFQSSSYFTKVFTKNKGYRPSEARQRLLVRS